VSIPQERIDELVLSFARTEWRKVAFIISRVFFECLDAGTEIEAHRVAGRILALVETGKLQSQGDLSRWRHSEVRLP